MEIRKRSLGGVSIVEVVGDIDGSTAPEAQGEILPLVQPGCRILLDMSELNYLSSAGLRMMLLMFRQVSGCGGNLALTGLSEDIKDTMSLTGFLDFFTTHDTLDAGLAAMNG